MLGLILGLVGAGGAAGLLTYLVGPAAIFSVMKQIPAWVYIACALAALIAFLFISRAHALDRAKADETQLATICAATRAAADNSKLNCRDVPAQIRELGTAVTNLKDGIAHQNAAVDALAVKTAAQQQMAAEAQKRASQRVGAAEAASQRLDASAHHSPAPGAPCAPSKALQEQWQ